MPNIHDLRIWWIPQVPGKAFMADVQSIREGQIVCQILARYDQFQLDNHIKPDYANAGGVVEWDGHDWSDIYDSDGNGVDIHTPASVVAELDAARLLQLRSAAANTDHPAGRGD